MSQQNSQHQQRSGSAPRKQTDGLSPKERHAKWVASKVERAGQDNYNVISSKTKNLNDFTNLLNINDTLMAETLLSFGSNPRVSITVLEELRLKIEEPKQMLNRINAEICALLGRTYRPPRGFRNPLEANKGKQQQAPAKQTAAQAAPAPAQKPAKKKKAKKAPAAKTPSPAATAAVEPKQAAATVLPLVPQGQVDAGAAQSIAA